MINKVSELLISSIDESKLSREETTINVNGETKDLKSTTNNCK